MGLEMEWARPVSRWWVRPVSRQWLETVAGEGR